MKFFDLIILVSFLVATLVLPTAADDENSKKRPRDFNIQFGQYRPGPNNAITDVTGVMVGHKTIVANNNIRTGVTAILPHNQNLFWEKVPAAIYIGNGFGKLAGYSQVRELGEIETPILLTNTLSVGAVMEGTIQYTLALPGNENVRSVNAIVGEVNDGYLNDIREFYVRPEHAIEAIKSAKPGPVAEGNVGGGTGSICHRFKGGIGTASRKFPNSKGGYTIGVLVQTNFGKNLIIDGVPVGKLLKKNQLSANPEKEAKGSCMIVVATDAPLDSRNLGRLAKRTLFGMAKTGGIAGNGSGDYVIAFSTAKKCRIIRGKNQVGGSTLANDKMSPLFQATVEATEEAIINSLFAAKTMTGRNGHKVQALPIEKTLQMLREYKHLD